MQPLLPSGWVPRVGVDVLSFTFYVIIVFLAMLAGSCSRVADKLVQSAIVQGRDTRVREMLGATLGLLDGGVTLECRYRREK